MSDGILWPATHPSPGRCGKGKKTAARQYGALAVSPADPGTPLVTAAEAALYSTYNKRSTITNQGIAFGSSGSGVDGERNSMRPLDATAILVQAVDSVLRRSVTSLGTATRAEPRYGEAVEATRARPSTAETETSPGSPRTSQLSPSRPALDERAASSAAASIQPSVGPVVDNPLATIRMAEDVLRIVATGGSSAILRRRVAAAAYLAETEAQKELARMRRERPAGVRQWFA